MHLPLRNLMCISKLDTEAHLNKKVSDRMEKVDLRNATKKQTLRKVGGMDPKAFHLTPEIDNG